MGGMIGVAKKLLLEHKIVTSGDLRKIIHGKKTLQTSHAQFQILRNDDLNLDDENRNHVKEFIFSRIIFDCSEICLRNAKKIELIDCIFLGELTIGRTNEESAEVLMDSCFFEKQLSISFLGEQAPSINITSCSAQHFRLGNLRTNSINILGSIFGATTLDRIKAQELSISGGSLGSFKITDYSIEKVSISRNEFKLASQPGSYGFEDFISRFFSCRKKFNPFSIPRSNDGLYEKESRDEQVRNLLETFDFLLSRTEIRRNKKDQSHVKYLRALSESHSSISRFFVFITGAFLKPLRLMVLSGLIVFLFATIYASPSCSFSFSSDPTKVMRLDFPNALYFSGVTFTTLGYGDISPINETRFVALLEALVGVIMSSSLAVSIARRYIE